MTAVVDDGDDHAPVVLRRLGFSGRRELPGAVEGEGLLVHQLRGRGRRERERDQEDPQDSQHTRLSFEGGVVWSGASVTAVPRAVKTPDAAPPAHPRLTGSRGAATVGARPANPSPSSARAVKPNS